MLTLPRSTSPTTAGTPIPTSVSRSRARVVLIATSDSTLRARLREILSGLRWQVMEAPGGAEAWTIAESTALEALVVDPWLPDLDVQEFLVDFHGEHPMVDIVMTDGAAIPESPRSPYRQELLFALRSTYDSDTAAWKAAPVAVREIGAVSEARLMQPDPSAIELGSLSNRATMQHLDTAGDSQSSVFATTHSLKQSPLIERIPELMGEASVMLEVSRRIRLVAARTTPVLIEGPTGSGKELVAAALHRFSGRSRKPFVAINCAAIPEALLEAELFGHTRGAFTGAVQGRTGRIEAADGGTLFLDEIGEMPLALQSKLLRFFESGELQRIGDNETVKVDVRLIAATHQPLAEHAHKGLFRSDLYYRLAVFLIRTPALVEHMEDLPILVNHFVGRMGRSAPLKTVDPSAMAKLAGHDWPGNVRELQHVLERAAILAGDEPTIRATEIDFGFSLVN